MEPDLVIGYRSSDPLRAAHSGTVAGVASGFGALGLRVALVNAEAPRTVVRGLGVLERTMGGRRSSYSARAARLGPAWGRVRSRDVRRVPILLMVSDSGCPTDGTAVSFEDMTVAQAERHPEYLGLPAAELARWRQAQERLYKRVDACCPGSHWTAESLRTDYGVDPAKVHVVGRGHGLEIDPPSRDWATPRFLFSGRDWKRKNGDAVLRAFTALRAEHPGATLHVVGRHPRLAVPGVQAHGELLLERATDRARLSALYRESTCFVMPSSVEAFGISYVEAASFGVPSIGTTIGGAATAIGSDGGLLVDPADPAALLEAMREAAEPARAAGMGAAAAERAKLFTWPRVAERLARVLLPELSRARSLAPFLD